MRTRLLVENPSTITFTMKIEATASEFEALRDELSSAGVMRPHSCYLRGELNNLLAQARKIFYADDVKNSERPKEVLLGSFKGHTLYIDASISPDDRADLIKRLG